MIVQSREEAELKTAIHAVAKRARGDVARAASARFWARRHPWIAVAIGITSGFVAGEWVSAAVCDQGATGGMDSSSRPTGWVSRLVGGLFALALSGLRAALTTVLRELWSVAKRRESWFPPI